MELALTAGSWILFFFCVVNNSDMSLHLLPSVLTLFLKIGTMIEVCCLSKLKVCHAVRNEYIQKFRELHCLSEKSIVFFVREQVFRNGIRMLHVGVH
jgi:hypothetical protein